MHLVASRQTLTPHCLAAIFDSQVPSPKLSLKMPSKLPLPTGEGFLSQSCPHGEGNCAAIDRQKLSCGNFCLAASPPCPSFPCFFFGNGKEDNQINKDFLSLSNPWNPWKRRENAVKKKSSPGKRTRNSTKKTKERKDRADSRGILGHLGPPPVPWPFLNFDALR